MLGQLFVLTLCGLVTGLVTSSRDGACWNIRECKFYKGLTNEFNDLELYLCLRKCLYLDGCELAVYDNAICKLNKETVKLEDIIEGELGSRIFLPKPCGDKDNTLVNCKGEPSDNPDMDILLAGNQTAENLD